jgi:hypothetical protein
MLTEPRDLTAAACQAAPRVRKPRQFDKSEVSLIDVSSVSLLCRIRENPLAGVLGGSAAMPIRPLAPRRLVNTVQRRFILQTHILGGPLTAGGRIAQQVALEQSISRVLGLGLFAPFHIKTLKRLTGAASFDRCPLAFLDLLLRHSAPLLRQRHVAIVIDDLEALLAPDPDRAIHLMEALVSQGFLILIKPSSGQLMRATSISVCGDQTPCV